MTIVNSKGILMERDGDDFREVAKFPIEETGKKWRSGSGTEDNDNVVPNGIELIDDNIHILANGIFGNSISTPEPNFPSGVWEYDPNVGLYQKYSLSAWDGAVTSGNDDEWGVGGGINRVGALKGIEYASMNEKFLAGADIYTADNTIVAMIMTTRNKAQRS